HHRPCLIGDAKAKEASAVPQQRRLSLHAVSACVALSTFGSEPTIFLIPDACGVRRFTLV
ncbi:hypothetical protein KIP88_44955, partial [Bradyrhizobium sp. SRL28]|uniref:hypothetical protein n=1 Tax=Bradyrhizobium sp. SRL28 TaxID=2836178 RepID=UPI001BDE261F